MGFSSSLGYPAPRPRRNPPSGLWQVLIFVLAVGFLILLLGVRAYQAWGGPSSRQELIVQSRSKTKGKGGHVDFVDARGVHYRTDDHGYALAEQPGRVLDCEIQPAVHILGVRLARRHAGDCHKVRDAD